MGSRRRAREQALQLLYQIDSSSGDLEGALKLFWEEASPEDEGVRFTSSVVRGVAEHRASLDAIIEEHSINWKLHRMPCVDRNILRIAVFEFLHCEDIPPMVSINEAIEMGKRFSTGESGAFINGILDKISKNEDLLSPQQGS